MHRSGLDYVKWILLAPLMLLGYAINRLYSKTTDSLKHPDKPDNSDERSVISDLLSCIKSIPSPRLPTERPPEAYEMSGHPQNLGNFPAWFSRMVGVND